MIGQNHFNRVGRLRKVREIGGHQTSGQLKNQRRCQTQPDSLPSGVHNWW
jgi:hypothetical protein